MIQEISESQDKEIDLREILDIIWKKKIFIVSFTSIFAAFSIFFSLSLPNIYTSQAVLAPVSSEESLSSNRQFSSLTNFGLGLNLPPQNTAKSLEAIERIESFEFFSKHFLPSINIEDMMAVKSWNAKNNRLNYQSSKFNENDNKWISKVPSSQKAYRVYKSLLSLNQDRKTSYITLSISHKSPYIAKEWVEIIILKINETMRDIDKVNAQNSINFLNTSSKSTNFQSIKETMANLLENQLQILMLASSNEFYVLKILDSPIVPERKSSPQRSIICIIGTLLGGFIAIVYILIQRLRVSND